MFLINPTLGNTLQSVFQPFMKGPTFIGKMLSAIIKALRNLLYPFCLTLYPILKFITHTSLFYCIFIASALVGGYPPDQPAYFTAYCQDIFTSRFHTQHLLDLIVALDEDLPYTSTILPQGGKTVIISGMYMYEHMPINLCESYQFIIIMASTHSSIQYLYVYE